MRLMPSSRPRANIASTSSCVKLFPHSPPNCQVPIPITETSRLVLPSRLYFMPLKILLSRLRPLNPMNPYIPQSSRTLVRRKAKRLVEIDLRPRRNRLPARVHIHNLLIPQPSLQPIRRHPQSHLVPPLILQIFIRSRRVIGRIATIKTRNPADSPAPPPN